MSTAARANQGDFVRHVTLISTIAGREIRATFTSFLAYVFIGLFVVVAVLLFFLKENFITNDQASARGFFRWIPWLLAGVAPALTMRLWADEKKLGTYEILATLPLTALDLVLGKFLGAFAMLALALLFTLGIPVCAEVFGDLDWGPVIGGYVGALLLGAGFLSIGLVTSALAQDQILALLFGWVGCALWLLPDAAFWESIMPKGAAAALKGVGFEARFAAIERGVISLPDVLFYLSVTAWFLFVNTALIRWRRFTV